VKRVAIGIAFAGTFYAGMVAGRQVFIEALKIHVPKMVKDVTPELTPLEQIALKQAIVKITENLQAQRKGN